MIKRVEIDSRSSSRRRTPRPRQRAVEGGWQYDLADVMGMPTMWRDGLHTLEGTENAHASVLYIITFGHKMIKSVEIDRVQYSMGKCEKKDVLYIIE